MTLTSRAASPRNGADEPAGTSGGSSGATSRRALRASSERMERDRVIDLTLGRGRTGRTVAYVLVALLAILWLVPLVWAVISSLKTEPDASATPLSLWPADGWTFENYLEVFRVGDIPLWLWNSLLVSVVVTAITVLTSALAAYAFSRKMFGGWLWWLTIAAIVVPPQILIVPLFDQMVAMRLSDTLLGIALPQVVQPLMVIILKNFFDQIPPELEDAARIDGASELRVFRSVVMPLSRSILVAVSIFVFITTWNNFLWPFIVTNSPDNMTIPVGLGTVRSAYGVQYAQDMASAVIGALPLLIVFMLFQRQIIRGFATSGMGGQ
jgi:multiple sugar transport system permease protein